MNGWKRLRKVYGNDMNLFEAKGDHDLSALFEVLWLQQQQQQQQQMQFLFFLSSNVWKKNETLKPHWIIKFPANSQAKDQGAVDKYCVTLSFASEINK